MIISVELKKYQKKHKEYYLQDFYKDLVKRGVIKSYTHDKGHFSCSGAEYGHAIRLRGDEVLYDGEVQLRERQLERERQKRFHYFCWIAIVGILCLGAIALFMNLIWPNTLIY